MSETHTGPGTDGRTRGTRECTRSVGQEERLGTYNTTRGMDRRKPEDKGDRPYGKGSPSGGTAGSDIVPGSHKSTGDLGQDTMTSTLPL